MLIYKNETSIASLILSNRSVAYHSALEEASPEEFPQVALANINTETPDTPDLFYTKSILVSTNLNKNDDYFDPQEVWAARKTPVDKPMNIEHDHKRVVGHITQAWAIDNSHNILADDTSADDLPDFFHLCNGSVIYTRWQDENLQAQADELIKNIKDGEYCVSMEAWFTNFDYLLTKDEENIVIARDAETSFLTKKLRCYGGDGVHDGYLVNRVLKNITFSACGYVKRPANPDSIIFTTSGEKNLKNIKKAENSGVYLKCTRENKMSDSILEKQVAELKDEVKALQSDNKSLSDQLAEANTEKLGQELAEAQAELAEAKKYMEDEKKKMKEREEASCALTQELSDLKEKYDAVVAELNQEREVAKKADRVQKLVEAGLTKEDAESKVDSLVALSDEQFEVVAKTISSVKPEAPAKADEEETEEEQAAEANSELDSAEEEASEEVDATASSDSNDSEFSALATAMAEHYDEKFSKENK